MAYLNLLAEELYLFSRIKTLRCPGCHAYAFIPHVSRHTYPMVWCYCNKHHLFHKYAKYQ